MKLQYFVLFPFVASVMGSPIMLYRRDPTPPPEGAPSQTPARTPTPPPPPPPEQHPVGSYVIAQPRHWGVTKQQNPQFRFPHPAVVLDKHNAGGQSELDIAVMSHKHPGNPPQVGLDAFHPGHGFQHHPKGPTNIALESHRVPAASMKDLHPPIPPHMPQHKVDELRGHIANPAAVPPHLHAHSSDHTQTWWQQGAIPPSVAASSSSHHPAGHPSHPAPVRSNTQGHTPNHPGHPSTGGGAANHPHPYRKPTI